MKKLLVIALVAAMASSCTVSYKSRTARTANAPVEFAAQTSVADLVVSETKVTGDSEGCIDGKITKLKLRLVPGLKAKLENYAITKALQNTNSDVLVDPQFTYHYKKNNLVSVTVTGYPAVHRNFRTISYEETVKARIEEKAAANRKAPQVVVYGAPEK